MSSAMAKPDQTEREIEQILAAAGGWVTLDFIRAQLFHRYSVSPKSGYRFWDNS